MCELQHLACLACQSLTLNCPVREAGSVLSFGRCELTLARADCVSDTHFPFAAVDGEQSECQHRKQVRPVERIRWLQYRALPGIATRYLCKAQVGSSRKTGELCGSPLFCFGGCRVARSKNHILYNTGLQRENDGRFVCPCAFCRAACLRSDREQSRPQIAKDCRIRRPTFAIVG